MKSIIPFFVLFAVLVTSCKKNEPTPDTTNRVIVPFTEVGKQMQSQNAGMTGTTGTAIATNPTATPTTNVSDPNPAHGQPKHRCDIPVGASLSTPKAAAQAPVQTASTQTVQAVPNPTTTVTTTPAQPTPAVVTAEGMNPPHGQENHRCDIAVGAPLPKS